MSNNAPEVGSAVEAIRTAEERATARVADARLRAAALLAEAHEQAARQVERARAEGAARGAAEREAEERALDLEAAALLRDAQETAATLRRCGARQMDEAITLAWRIVLGEGP